MSIVTYAKDDAVGVVTPAKPLLDLIRRVSRIARGPRQYRGQGLPRHPPAQ